ncbi:NUDIX domain-containing protein [Patescibacteria group bacterium]|nr:NUDIX domain-containing protein [Patescibacteria group bacterium]
MPGNKSTYSILVNAIVVKDGKILISQRSGKEKHEPGKWTIPGGKLEETGDFYEALQYTAKKEILEETGIVVKDKMRLLCNNTFNHVKDNELVLAIVFLCYYESGEARPMEDTANIRWIKVDQVDNYEFPHANVKNYVLKGFEFLKSSQV